MNNFSKTALTCLTFCGVMTLMGCDNQDSVESSSAEIVETTDDAIVVETENATEQNSGDMTLANMTAQGIHSSYFNPIINDASITPEQKACLESVDKNIGAKEAQAYYLENFSAEEMAELNDFYRGDIGKQLVALGNEQMLIDSGTTVDNPTPQLSEEQVGELMTIMQKPTFIKYQQLNSTDGEGSLLNALRPVVNAEFERCKIDASI